jgi:hypothetical protein
MRNRFAPAIAGLLLTQAEPATASQVVTTTIEARSLTGNRIGIPTTRRVSVYLPDGHKTSGRRFPVVYYLPAFFEDHTAPFANHGAQAVLDAAIRDRVIPPMILVSADYGTPMGGSWFVNSPVTGHWEDFCGSRDRPACRCQVPHPAPSRITRRRGRSDGRSWRDPLRDDASGRVRIGLCAASDRHRHGPSDDALAP